MVIPNNFVLRKAADYAAQSYKRHYHTVDRLHGLLTRVAYELLTLQSIHIPDIFISLGTSINSHLIENSYGRAALSAFVRLQ
jgi:hypothetical protein